MWVLGRFLNFLEEHPSLGHRSPTQLTLAVVVIERLIAKNLYSQLDLNFTAHANWTIIEYFDHAKKANGGG